MICITFSNCILYSLSLSQFRPVMLGEIGTTGNFGGVFLHQFGKLKMRCNAQVPCLLPHT